MTRHFQCIRERETKRQRERQRETDRETDRQRETDRETDRARQRDRERQIERHRDIERQRDRETERVILMKCETFVTDSFQITVNNINHYDIY